MVVGYFATCIFPPFLVCIFGVNFNSFHTVIILLHILLIKKMLVPELDAVATEEEQ